MMIPPAAWPNVPALPTQQLFPPQPQPQHQFPLMFGGPLPLAPTMNVANAFSLSAGVPAGMNCPVGMPFPHGLGFTNNFAFPAGIAPLAATAMPAEVPPSVGCAMRPPPPPVPPPPPPVPLAPPLASQPATTASRPAAISEDTICANRGVAASSTSAADHASEAASGPGGSTDVGNGGTAVLAQTPGVTGCASVAIGGSHSNGWLMGAANGRKRPDSESLTSSEHAEKCMMVRRVKDLQRNSPDGKEMWQNFLENKNKRKCDPALHDLSFLRCFWQETGVAALIASLVAEGLLVPDNPHGGTQSSTTSNLEGPPSLERIPKGVLAHLQKAGSAAIIDGSATAAGTGMTMVASGGAAAASGNTIGGGPLGVGGSVVVAAQPQSIVASAVLSASVPGIDTMADASGHPCLGSRLDGPVGGISPFQPILGSPGVAQLHGAGLVPLGAAGVCGYDYFAAAAMAANAAAHAASSSATTAAAAASAPASDAVQEVDADMLTMAGLEDLLGVQEAAEAAQEARDACRGGMHRSKSVKADNQASTCSVHDVDVSQSRDGEEVALEVQQAALMAQQALLLQQYQFQEQARLYEVQRQAAQNGPTAAEEMQARPEDGGAVRWRPMHLCKQHFRGECTRAERCKFAHSYEGLHPFSQEHPNNVNQQSLSSVAAILGNHANVLAEQSEADSSSGEPVMRMQRRQSMCQRFSKEGCLLGDKCPYAHDEKDLGTMGHVIISRVKTQICDFWEKGDCVYGKYCMKAHGKAEVGRPKPEYMVQPNKHGRRA
eukprot:TRINITY_DN22482_c0_g1_i1.p1 TRINITY_DN22482_c0_g1~~TRINITY_DN22482_c0_g1_i1.p1  ORF type:complete len:775 (-),score=144.66 TRINITY_DN22482_c0_g1_i1:159-2483(-)